MHRNRSGSFVLDCLPVRKPSRSFAKEAGFVIFFSLNYTLKEVDMSLKGKHALITGSSRGIGRGIALKLAASGAKVAIHYYQNEAAANDTLGQVRKRGSDGLVIRSEEHTSELQSRGHLVCRLLLEKKKKK